MMPRMTGVLSIFLIFFILVGTAPIQAFPSEFKTGDREADAPLAREVVKSGTKVPDFPESSRGKGYPHLFTRKTSSLLAEALHMLHRAKDMRERQWLEAFVHRLRSLAADLERTSTDIPGKTSQTFGSSPKTDYAEDSLVLQLHDGLPPRTTAEQERGPVGGQRGRALTSSHSPDTLASSTEPLPSTTSGLTKSQRFKELTRKKLLQQIYLKIQKLQQLGGSQEDVLKLLKRTDHQPMAVPSTDGSIKYEDESDTIGEENGAAAGEMEVDEPPEQLSTMAASPSRSSVPGMEPVLLKTTDATSPADRHQVSPQSSDDVTRGVTPDNRHQHHNPLQTTEDDDDLVRQLQEERLILVSTVVPSSSFHQSEPEYPIPNPRFDENRNRFDPVQQHAIQSDEKTMQTEQLLHHMK